MEGPPEGGPLFLRLETAAGYHGGVRISLTLTVAALAIAASAPSAQDQAASP